MALKIRRRVIVSVYTDLCQVVANVAINGKMGENLETGIKILKPYTINNLTKAKQQN